MQSLSIVVPVYSAEKYLYRLVEEIEIVRESWKREGAPIALGELLLVDDGAIDSSPALVDEIAAKKPWVVALHLSRNFGQHPATIAGILHSAGDWVATIDEDLQHPPGEIPKMLALAVSHNADIVYGQPHGKVHENALRDQSSRGFKKLMKWLTGNKHIGSINSCRLIRGPIARAASGACAHDTYFDIALLWFTQRVQTLTLSMKDERFISSGKSGYRLRSLVSHARRLIFSGQIKALRLGAFIGFSTAVLSGLASVLLLLWKFVTPASIAAPGWTSLILTVCFFSGMILTLTGLLLEYVTILVLRAHGKPLFFTVDRSSDRELAEYFRNRDS